MCEKMDARRTLHCADPLRWPPDEDGGGRRDGLGMIIVELLSAPVALEPSPPCVAVAYDAAEGGKEQQLAIIWLGGVVES